MGTVSPEEGLGGFTPSLGWPAAAAGLIRRYILRSGIVGSSGSSIFSFLRSLQIVQWWYQLTSPPTVYQGTLFLYIHTNSFNCRLHDDRNSDRKRNRRAVEPGNA